MPRYTKEHYEDVTVLLHFHHDINVRGPDAIAALAGHFADLFAADSPRQCIVAGDHAKAECDDKCLYGFDRAEFLRACGIEGS